MFLRALLPLGIYVYLAAPLAASAVSPPLAEIRRIDERLQGNLGVYIKDLDARETIAYQADRPWYLSSTTKIPIAIAFLKQIEMKRFTLGDLTSLRDSDRVDGMGTINFMRTGSLLSFDFLLEQMLIHSDSVAADILFRIVGPGAVNEFLEQNAPGKFGTFTSILDVRREAYSEVHPNARYLPNAAFFALKRAHTNEAKLRELEHWLGKRRKRFATQSIADAFERFYETEKNSGTLVGYGEMLEKLARGKLLNHDHTQYLLRVLRRTETGRYRIKHGLPPGVLFAHKTGTQMARICDVGIVLRNESRPDAGIVVAACVEKFASRAEAERALRGVGEVIARYYLQHLPAPGRLSYAPRADQERRANASRGSRGRVFEKAHDISARIAEVRGETAFAYLVDILLEFHAAAFQRRHDFPQAAHFRDQDRLAVDRVAFIGGM